jgi:antitoxin CptB
MTYTEIPAKLRWACRRGMLELDVLLGNFLDEAFLGLAEDEQNIFIQFLNNNDQDLFMWLTARTVAPDETDAKMVGKIRFHAQNRH